MHQQASCPAPPPPLLHTTPPIAYTHAMDKSKTGAQPQPHSTHRGGAREEEQARERTRDREGERERERQRERERETDLEINIQGERSGEELGCALFLSLYLQLLATTCDSNFLGAQQIKRILPLYRRALRRHILGITPQITRVSHHSHTTPITPLHHTTPITPLPSHHSHHTTPSHHSHHTTPITPLPSHHSHSCAAAPSYLNHTYAQRDRETATCWREASREPVGSE